MAAIVKIGHTGFFSISEGRDTLTAYLSSGDILFDALAAAKESGKTVYVQLGDGNPMATSLDFTDAEKLPVKSALYVGVDEWGAQVAIELQETTKKPHPIVSSVYIEIGSHEPAKPTGKLVVYEPELITVTKSIWQTLEDRRREWCEKNNLPFTPRKLSSEGAVEAVLVENHTPSNSANFTVKINPKYDKLVADIFGDGDVVAGEDDEDDDGDILAGVL